MKEKHSTSPRQETTSRRRRVSAVITGLALTAAISGAAELARESHSTHEYSDAVRTTATETLKAIANNDSPAGIAVENGVTLTRSAIAKDDISERKQLNAGFDWQPVTVPAGAAPTTVIQKRGWGVVDFSGMHGTAVDSEMKIMTVLYNNPPAIDASKARDLLDEIQSVETDALDNNAEQSTAQLSATVDQLVDASLSDNPQIYLPADIH